MISRQFTLYFNAIVFSIAERIFFTHMKNSQPPSSQSLTLLEKISVKLSRINESATYKTFQLWYCSKIMAKLFVQLTGRRLYLDNYEWIIHLKPSQGVVWAGNHRSLYDLGVATAALYARKMKWPRRTCFPVRANFFYNSILGIFTNYFFCAGMMYPPIFRDPAKSDWNKDALQRIIRFLSVPGSDLGFHPEGKRGKGPNPYELLPAKSGIGQIIYEAKPLVIPFFMQGISNNVLKIFKESGKKNARRTNPIVLVFGKPVEYDSFLKQEPSNELHKEISEHVLNAIKQLIPREQEIRYLCVTGQISDNNNHWLI